MSLEDAFGWDAAPTARQLISVFDTVEISANFLVFQFLKCLSGHFNVTLVGQKYSSEHYTQVCKKLVNELIQGITLGEKFSFLDLRSECQNRTMPWIEDTIIQIVLETERPCIILDEIVGLVYLGHALKDVVVMISRIARIALDKGGTIVLFSHDDNENDKEQAMLNEWLRYESDICVTVGQLESGYSEGISGQMDIKSMRGESRFLFKLHQSKLDIFVRGISSI